MNLPSREVRFLPGNIILVMFRGEPKWESMDNVLKVLVAELQVLWEGVRMVIKGSSCNQRHQ